jgi:hypothetical protein
MELSFWCLFFKCPYFKFLVILVCCHRKKIEKNQSRSLTLIQALNETHYQDQAYTLLHIMQAFTPLKPSASGFTHHFPMLEDIVAFIKGPLLIIMMSSEAN